MPDHMPTSGYDCVLAVSVVSGIICVSRWSVVGPDRLILPLWSSPVPLIVP